MKSNKVLVIFETNIIRNPKYNFGEIDFGSDFGSVREYVRNNELTNLVDFAIAQMSIDELSYGRQAEYQSDKGKLFELSSRMNGVPGFKIINPQDDFQFPTFYRGHVNKFIKRNKLIIIGYPPKIVFSNVILRSLEKRPPFLVSNQHSDYGFKDVIIWESILCFKSIRKYNKVVLFTNDLGFESQCEKEFSKVHPCYFKICKDFESVIKELEVSEGIKVAIEGDTDIADDERTELIALVYSDYFISSLTNFIKESIKIDEGRSIELLSPMTNSEDNIIDDEVVGKIIYSKARVKVDGEIKRINIKTVLDDANGIESHEIYE
ncbi:MAG: PIN domain-containing protein [Patescibacteria group bacterium]|jgi:hypothetical protein